MSWPPQNLLIGPAKPLPLTSDEKAGCEAAWARLTTSGAYESDIPKWRFLCWATDYLNLLAHGSNNPEIALFEPRMQPDWFGRPTNAVFATPDGIWPMYFAIIDRSRYVGSLRNLFVVDEQRRRRYWFSINEQLLADPPLKSGAVYLLRSDTFVRTTGANGEPTEEWTSALAVSPLAKVEVDPNDFPFLNDLTGHEDGAAARLVELQVKVLGNLERIDSVSGTHHLVVAPHLVDAAAELAKLLSESGLADVTIHFEPDASAIVISGPAADGLVSAVERRPPPHA